MPVSLFFCYTREDEALLNKLRTHLQPLQRQGLIEFWSDRDISAGTEWEREISLHLNTAQIILLLVSPDFMNSDYCYGIEMQRALERHKRGEVRVIPIILRPIYWSGTPLGKLQALPTDGKPITSASWHNLDEALYNVTEEIRKVVEQLTAPHASTSRMVSETYRPRVLQEDFQQGHPTSSLASPTGTAFFQAKNQISSPRPFVGNTPLSTGSHSSLGGIDFFYSPRFFELSGVALLLGSLISVVAGFMDFFVSDQSNPLNIPLNIAIIVANFLLLLGLPGFHMKQASKTGWLGHIGLVVLLIGLLVSIIGGQIYLSTSLPPVGLNVATTLLQFLGGILLGIAMIRASVFPLWTGILLIVASIAMLGYLIGSESSFFNGLNSILTAIVFAWLGYILLPKQTI